MLHEEQIAEWTENPVTVELLRLVENKLREYERFSPWQCIQPEPHQTQAFIAALGGEYSAWEDVVEILEGDWDSIAEIEEDDYEE